MFEINYLSKSTWNLNQPLFIGCFNWMIPNLYMKNGCCTKHPFKTGCLEFQKQMYRHLIFLAPFCPTIRKRKLKCHFVGVLRWAIWFWSCGRQIKMRNAFQNTMVPWSSSGAQGMFRGCLVGMNFDEVVWWFDHLLCHACWFVVVVCRILWN